MAINPDEPDCLCGGWKSEDRNKGRSRLLQEMYEYEQRQHRTVRLYHGYKLDADGGSPETGAIYPEKVSNLKTANGEDCASGIGQMGKCA